MIPSSESRFSLSFCSLNGLSMLARSPLHPFLSFRHFAISMSSSWGTGLAQAKQANKIKTNNFFIVRFLASIQITLRAIHFSKVTHGFKDLQGNLVLFIIRIARSLYVRLCFVARPD